MDRYLKNQLVKDLEKKMVFLVGPRQVGKTWLAKNITSNYDNYLYLNYDNIDDREVIGKQGWFPEVELLIFDEIHKMKNWKNYLKGVFDTKPENQKILVTGSARLDYFRQMGDSLSGRFFQLRLFPVSYSEMKKNSDDLDYNELIFRSGFPEPFLEDSHREVRRWRMQYVDGIIRNDVLDFENIRDFNALNTLLELLRSRVGSPVSHKSLAEDIGTSPNTIKKYIEILESLFIVFKIHPYSKNIARAITREPKIYFYDTGLVKGDDGIKVENLTAVSLYKDVCGRQDLDGENTRLGYIRTRDKREVDFCIIEDDAVSKLLEVKLSEHNPAKNLIYFKNKYDIPTVQLVYKLKNEMIRNDIEIRDGVKYLGSLRY